MTSSRPERTRCSRRPLEELIVEFLVSRRRSISLNVPRVAVTALSEAFNDRFRAECLNQHWFLTLADAREKNGVPRVLPGAIKDLTRFWGREF
ncbi:Putative transposase (fragment) [Sinorhizobium meliloti 1021]|uniref:Transposase n=1 Tax=Rhizobium meliloti (strain 1021) TaxID=266834 RepID=B2REE4_RHIME